MTGREAGTVGAMKGRPTSPPRRSGSASSRRARTAPTSRTCRSSRARWTRRPRCRWTARRSGGVSRLRRASPSAARKSVRSTAREVVYGGDRSATRARITAEQAKASLVVLADSDALVRIAATSPLAGAAGGRRGDRPELTPAAIATGRSPTLTLPPRPQRAVGGLTLSMTNARGGASCWALRSEEAQRGAAGGKVARAISCFVHDGRRRRATSSPSCPAPIRRCADSTSPSARTATTSGYRATGAVDHDSLHLYRSCDSCATREPDGQADERARSWRAAQRRHRGDRVNLDSVRAQRPARRDSINNGADDDGSGIDGPCSRSPRRSRKRAREAEALAAVRLAHRRGEGAARLASTSPTIRRCRATRSSRRSTST